MGDGLCLCLCGGRTPIASRNRKARGVVKGEHARFITRHNLRNNNPDYSVDKNGCWNWSKSKSGGYGNAWRNGGKIKAHRKYYEAANGPIAPGLQIDHLCRNPACVNPKHLEPVTHAENVRRGRHTKLSLSDIELIKKIGRSQPLKVVAERFSVHLSNISDILTGKIWVAQ